MTVLVLSKPAFNAVLDEIPTLAHKLLVATARRLPRVRAVARPLSAIAHGLTAAVASAVL